MNQLLVLVVALVLFVHFGGANVPKILKDNKQMIYGLTIGLVLCSFFGVNVEGWSGCTIQDAPCGGIGENCTDSNDCNSEICGPGSTGLDNSTCSDRAPCCQDYQLPPNPSCGDICMVAYNNADERANFIGLPRTPEWKAQASANAQRDQSICLNDCFAQDINKNERARVAAADAATPPTGGTASGSGTVPTKHKK